MFPHPLIKSMTIQRTTWETKSGQQLQYFFMNTMYSRGGPKELNSFSGKLLTKSPFVLMKMLFILSYGSDTNKF
jgi:hypothetical protein